MYTQDQIQDQVKNLSDLEIKKSNLGKNIVSLSEEIDAVSRKVEKIEAIKNQFPIEELREELELQKSLKSQQELSEARLELEIQKLDQKKKLNKKIKPCDCFEHKPTCKYVKDANKSASELDEQKSVISTTRKELRAVKSNLQKIVEKNLSTRLQKYEEILRVEQESKLNHSEMRLQMKEVEGEHQEVLTKFSQGKSLLREMRLRSIDEEKDRAVITMRRHLKKLESRISELDAERIYLTEGISVCKQKELNLSEEHERFGAVKSRWETYNTFTQAVDKKGIPLTILSLQLPQINAELQKILQGVVNFDLMLEADPDSNNMDIFIDYGDSRRIIECGSGMEKMISSLALRVALINVCNAPRSDVLIIDEGFGALDDKSIEACSRLLTSLKKYFANILIISHVDAVKDVVDNVLDIRKDGPDSNVRYA